MENENKNMEVKIKKKYFYGFIIIIIIVAGFYLYNNSVKGDSIDNGNNGNNGNGNSGETQKITLSMKNGNYYPNTINVKANQPVEITLDNSVRGCYRSFTIRDLGVVKYAKTPEDKIIFTPKKTGSFRFACSMGMGTGTIIVE